MANVDGLEGGNIYLQGNAVNLAFTTDIEGAVFVTVYGITVSPGPQNNGGGKVWLQIWQGSGSSPESNHGSWMMADCAKNGAVQFNFPTGIKIAAGKDGILKLKTSQSGYYAINVNARITTP